MTTKPPFSEKEINYIHDTDFLKTKSVIVKKIIRLFSEIETSLRPVVNKYSDRLPEGVLYKAGKISKGDHYMGLPYVVLDYPRMFDKSSVFAFRSIFWWGNFFSNTLQLSGEALIQYRPKLVDNIDLIIQENLYIGVNEEPWKHHYSPKNYQLAGDFEHEQLKTLLKEKEFIKLSQYINVGEWGSFQKTTIKNYTFFMHTLV